jgi:alanine dehydrogenase
VANIPGAYARTSTFALTNATFPYVLQIADKGYERAFEENEVLRRGVKLIDGEVVCQGVAESLEMPYIQNPFSPPSLKIQS